MRLEADKECMLCDYCGGIYFPEPNPDGVRVFDEPSNLQCSICTVTLFQAAVGGRRVEHCKRCRGLLIAIDWFLDIVHAMRARHEPAAFVPQQPDWRDLDRRIRCPQCKEEMDAHPYGGPGNVIIDTCETCSLNWLDHSELSRIVRAPDHEFSAPGS